MPSKLRLVAFRPATSSATSDTTYNLDLQEHPSISLNFQFSDIKEPETRKANFSQTFKLPFTDNNNEFFQTWFNVNLETLVFTTKAKFNAALYVGTVSQFEGFIQLKAVYQKAQMYEVVLMSNTADLFSVIGEKPLKDVFLNDDGSYSDELNHTFNDDNIKYSWSGTTTDFKNTNLVSLQDADAGVQKVMYPTSVTHPSFFYAANGFYLSMSQLSVDTLGLNLASIFMTPIEQFRPAIQLRTLFKLIFARSGFSYTSAFIDSTGDYASENYFGKLFMTTCNHLADSGTPTTLTGEVPPGTMQVGVSGEGGLYSEVHDSLDCSEIDFVPYPVDTICDDDSEIWNTDFDYFTKEHETMTSIYFRTRYYVSNLNGCSGDPTITIILQGFDVDGLITGTPNTPIPDTIYSTTFVGVAESTLIAPTSGTITQYLDISNMPIGASARILFKRSNFKPFIANALPTVFKLGIETSFPLPCSMESYAQITWSTYNIGVFERIINIPACIDDSILQKDFLKDIIQRFNLIILTDPADASNIIIEPYNDYLPKGSIKHWTEKLDTSKEIIIKDTTSLQKKTINLTDLEDNDLLNKEFKENQPNINVFGHKKITETNNDFAKGELKNDAIFSPYINAKVYAGANTSASLLSNMTVQYEFSYQETDEENVTENPLTETKPKLFYYNGSATTVKNVSGETVTYYIHWQPAEEFAINAYGFTTYPVCTPFDITPVDDAYTLTPDTKSLYWSHVPPLVGDLDIFNYIGEQGTWEKNTLYGLYWEKYLNSIYGVGARIMEAYIMLDAVDIFNFKFNDEIFIKDTYWRIIKIHNYQVGGTVSTKVTLLKVIDSLVLNEGCDYVLGYDADGYNTVYGQYYIWCSSDDADCTPDTTSSDQLGIYVQIACCNAIGGTPMTNMTEQEDAGLYPCGFTGSPLPFRLRSLLNSTSIQSEGQARTIISSKIGGRNIPLIKGTATTKLNPPILPYFGDDIVIKYNTKNKGVPQLNGESHRIVISGYTEGDTRGYAYAEGIAVTKIYIPIDSNMIIRVKGIATVIGGTSTTYTLGTTEAFAYYTAFKNLNSTITQLSTVGGREEFSITEGANPTTCTLNIAEDASTGELQFGLDDSQTDTKRVWALTVDLDVQQLINLQFPYGENWALWQDGHYIQLQNYDLLLWN